MKYFILLSLFISLAHAGECKLTGITRSCQKFETKFELSNLEACQDLAKKTSENKFFNFIGKDDQLIKTVVSFKENSIDQDEVLFRDEEECI
ncbi:hypothetical protein ACJVC5_18105 [Peredibacter sp. HCB2-198]|uniref:hypothetical protein n=1 Tax=Peredibacter sp. HCB2-198 TaxID=3383025 RepID=UPI0038B4E1FC